MKPAVINQAMQAYAEAAGKIKAGGQTAGSVDGLSSFDALVREQLQTSIADLRASEQQGFAAAAGTADLQSVVLAVSKAELSLQRVTAVRDRVIAAYEEIMRMPI